MTYPVTGPRSRLQGRAALAGVLATVCAVGACDSVLDIEDPKARPDMSEAGAAGEPSKPSNSAGTSNVDRIPNDGGAGGEGGSSVDVPPVTLAGSGGEGGEAPLRECTPKASRCTDKAPEICDETGHWRHNTKEAEGDCSLLCDDGKCVECQAPAKRCAACAEDDESCNTNQPQSCVDGFWKNEGASCKHYCDAGSCITPPSCQAPFAELTTCEGGKTSCCASALVPGGSFYRDFDGTDDYPDKTFPAKVSAFYLDKYEVTVARMRPFVNAFEQLKLESGDGKSSHVVGDSGWDVGLMLPKDKAELVDSLKCEGATWSDNPADNQDLPINCVSFPVAYAFCIWDGGRLPTEAEWNFAAAGGDEQRMYPWPTPAQEPLITPDYANYGDAKGRPKRVGSTQLGNGRWQQSDLAGNVAEWTLDYFGDYPETCEDCLNNTTALDRVWRGGAFWMPADFARVSLRAGNESQSKRVDIGFRCARDQQ